MAYLFNDQLKGALFRLKICPEKPPLSCQGRKAVPKAHTQNFGEYSLQSHQVELNINQSCPEQRGKDPTSGQAPDPLAPEAGGSGQLLNNKALMGSSKRSRGFSKRRPPTWALLYLCAMSKQPVTISLSHCSGSWHCTNNRGQGNARCLGEA